MTKLDHKRTAKKKNDLSINKRNAKKKNDLSINKRNAKKKNDLSINKRNAKKKNDLSINKRKPKHKIKAKGSITQKKKVPQRRQNKVKEDLNVKQLKTKKKIKDAQPKLIKKSHKSKVEKKDEYLMKKYRNIRKFRKETQKQDHVKFSDPTQLVNLETVRQAISGLRKLRAVTEKEKPSNSLLDASGDDSFIFLQVTISKMPYVIREQHLIKPRTIKMYLPNSLVNDETEVVLITRDLERGIRPDHEPTLNFFQELLRKHNAASLVSEIIPLRQLKVEYKEFEAKRNLSRRVDVVLCDDTILRFVPKFLGKHFYEKKKSPVQVNLKAKGLHNELKRALSVSQLIFTMQGNNALMKVGRLGHTDEAVAENIMAVVQKLANYVPGTWNNVQNLSLKLEKSKSVPFFVNLGSLNDVKKIHPRAYIENDPVSGTLTTCPKKCVTVFPDGSVTVQRLKKNKNRIPVEESEQPIKVTKKLKKKQKGKVETGEGKSKTKINELKKLETGKSIKVQEDQASETVVKSTKRNGEASKKSKAKKQKVENAKKRSESGKKKKTKKQDVSKKEDSDSGEEELEAQELAYLKKRNEEQEGEKGTSAEEEEGSEADDDSDPWDEDSDYDIAGSDDELYVG